jgi:hypothetical protein
VAVRGRRIADEAPALAAPNPRALNFLAGSVPCRDKRHCQRIHFFPLGVAATGQHQTANQGKRPNCRRVLRGKGLSQLKELSLVGVPVSDAGVAVLANLPGLEDLDVSDTPVGNKGLAHLKGLKDLLSLRLAGTRIQDGPLKALVGLKELGELDLHATIPG